MVRAALLALQCLQPGVTTPAQHLPLLSSHWHATHRCGSCKALHPKLCQLAADNPDTLVLKVEFDSNKALAKALGVKVRGRYMYTPETLIFNLTCVRSIGTDQHQHMTSSMRSLLLCPPDRLQK